MSYLLRVVLPDRPGMLGAVATALGRVEADITGVDVVERQPDGAVVDDFLVDLPVGRMPDVLVTACRTVPGVAVTWVGRYTAGADLHRDLEAVEAMTSRPHRAEQLLVELIPGVFRSGWGLLVEQVDGVAKVVEASGGAPSASGFAAPWLPLTRRQRLEVDPAWAPASWRDVVAVAAPVGATRRAVVLGRDGGPEILDSELARLAHLASLADTIRRSAG